MQAIAETIVATRTDSSTTVSEMPIFSNTSGENSMQNKLDHCFMRQLIQN